MEVVLDIEVLANVTNFEIMCVLLQRGVEGKN